MSIGSEYLDGIYFYQKHAKVLNQPIFVGFFLNFIFMVAKSKYFQFCFIFKNIFEIIVRKLFFREYKLVEH